MAKLQDLLKSMVIDSTATFRSASDPNPERALMIVVCREELRFDREQRHWYLQQYWEMPGWAHLAPMEADDWERVP